MPGFNLDDYEPVADRIERFWKDHPEGSIVTEMVHRDEQRFIVYVAVWRKNPTVLLGRELEGPAVNQLGTIFNRPDATGYAEEIIGSSNVNRTSALENCETSAIGRALANLGYAVKNRASREEMVKAQPAPRPRSGGRVSPSKPQSPESHEEAPRTNGTGEVATTTTILKRELLAACSGDKAKAGMIWREAVGQFGFTADDQIPDDMREVIGAALKVREPVS